jgi:hypothetical protein
MKRKWRMPLIFLSMLVLGLTAPVSSHLWQWDGAELASVNPSILKETALFLPAQTATSIQPGVDCISFINKRVEITRCGDGGNGAAWQSPESWRIDEVIVSDLNRDGVVEFGLLVWRPFRPWPIDRYLPSGGRIAEFHNLQGESCHFILIGWDGQKYRELWAGSALANPISQLKAADINGDGFNELIALESEYDSHSDSGSVTVWQWQGFGFYLQDRLKGNFSVYTLIKNGQNLSIWTE